PLDEGLVCLLVRRDDVLQRCGRGGQLPEVDRAVECLLARLLLDHERPREILRAATLGLRFHVRFGRRKRLEHLHRGREFPLHRAQELLLLGHGLLLSPRNQRTWTTRASLSKQAVQPASCFRLASSFGNNSCVSTSSVLAPRSRNSTVTSVSPDSGSSSQRHVYTSFFGGSTRRYAPTRRCVTAPSGACMWMRYRPPGRRSTSATGVVMSPGAVHCFISSGTVHARKTRSRGAAKVRRSRRVTGVTGVTGVTVDGQSRVAMVLSPGVRIGRGRRRARRTAPPSSGGTARSSGPPLSWGGRPAGSGAPGRAWREPRAPRARARAGACERRGARWRRGAPARRPTPRAPRGGRGSRAAWGRRARRRWHRARSLDT